MAHPRFLSSRAEIFILYFLCLTVATFSWHQQNSNVFLGTRLYYKNPRNAPTELCQRDEGQVQLQGRACLRKCSSDEDCKSKRKKCYCDGVCGMSCINPERECGEPEPPSELGKVRISGKMFGSKAIYTCPDGFRIIGMEERICQADGTWSGTAPACKKNVICKEPPTIEHARNNAPLGQTTFDLDTSLQYQCMPGYITKGFVGAKCFFYNGTSKWFGPDITCEPRSCGQPPDILNGRAEGICFHFSCKVQYLCQAGFELVGRSTHHCQADGTWTPKDLPTCVPVQCPLPENPPNGKAVFTSLAFSAEVSYDCKYGFMIVGERNRTCGPNKKWSGVQPACKEINCGSPGNLPNGVTEGSRTTLHGIIIFHCLHNMTFEGAERTVCQSDGKWSHPLPKCHAPCPIPRIEYGNVTSRPLFFGESFSTTTTPASATAESIITATREPITILRPGSTVPHGRIVGVSCEDRYEPAFNIQPSSCYNGTFTHVPKCQPGSCKSLPRTPRHGMVIAPKMEHGMKARFACRDGYILEGNNVTECQYGQWNGDAPTCNQTFCKFPGNIPNGRVLLVGNMGYYDYRNYVTKVANNRQIMFECDRGFVLSEGGPQAKTCVRGEWAPKTEPPSCLPSQHPNLRWTRSIRIKRKAIKTGGSSSSITRVGKGGGGGGAATRRGGKKKNKFGEEEEYDPAPMGCEWSEDETVQYEVIQKGQSENDTFSAGVILRVFCPQGFGVNLQNETIQCNNGKWKPKKPSCNALPCQAPYIVHGTFFQGSKPLFFHEPIANEKTIEFRCTRGFRLKGSSKIECHYGEWSMAETPECIPAQCLLPSIDHGNYIGVHRTGLTVPHGTSVDYICSGDYKKVTLGPATCLVGDWKPHKPTCKPISSYSGADDDKGKRSRRSCGTPPREKLTMAFREGLPVDFEREFSFANGTEVVYRCASLKPKAKFRWKVICDDGSWVVANKNNTYNMDACTNETLEEGAVNVEEFTAQLMKLVNGSCVHTKGDKHVVSFYNDHEVLEETRVFPHGAVLISRCYDIGKFNLNGAARRKCVSSQWFGVKPTCEGMSQHHDYDLAKPPTILFRYNSSEGSIVQSNDGKLVVYPGTTLKMECLWMRKFGSPKWHVSNKDRTYQEGWVSADEANRDSQLEYRLTIENASIEDTGTYSCVTPSRHKHSINIIIKSVECQPLPEHPDLIYGSTDTILGTRVNFTCRTNNALIGAKHIFCGASGNWSGALPKCENVECRDISLLPAMAPRALGSNGTIRLNETALPKITLNGKNIGSKAEFTCGSGYVIQGASEAFCTETGEWSTPIPRCREVECPDPIPPENGVATGNPPYKSGEVVQFDCNPGFMVEGQPMVACQENGKWSKPAGGMKCVFACTYPGTIIGGTISQVKYYYRIGETVTFDCLDGYELHGARMLHCGNKGKWSTSIPTCVAVKSG